tara:strand:- start:22768 stop:26697 length:3930 start_codon:yes stop_codon:yes gene_type:complete
MNPNDFDDILDSVLNEKGGYLGKSDSKKKESGKNPSHERYQKSPKRKKLVKSMTSDYDKRNPNSRDLRTKKSTAKRWPNGETAKELKSSGVDVAGKNCARPGCSKPAAELDHVDQSKATYTSSAIPKTQNLCRDHHTQKTRENVKKHGKDVNQHGKAKSEGFDRLIDMALNEGEFPMDQHSDDPLNDRKKIRKTFKTKVGRRKEYKDNSKIELELYRHPETPKILMSPKKSTDREAFHAAASEAGKHPDYYSVTVSKGDREVVYKGPVSNNTIQEVESSKGSSYEPVKGGDNGTGAITILDIPSGKPQLFNISEIKVGEYTLDLSDIIKIDGRVIDPKSLEIIVATTTKPNWLIKAEREWAKDSVSRMSAHDLAVQKTQEKKLQQIAARKKESVDPSLFVHDKMIQRKRAFEALKSKYITPIRELEKEFGFAPNTLDNFSLEKFSDKRHDPSKNKRYFIDLIDHDSEEYEELRKKEIAKTLQSSGNSSKFKELLLPRSGESLVDYENRVTKIEGVASSRGGRGGRNDLVKKRIAINSLLRKYNPVKRTEDGGLQWMSFGPAQELTGIVENIYLLIPKNMGTVTSSLTGEMEESKFPEWLQKNGASRIKGGIADPNQSLYGGGAKKIVDPNTERGVKLKPIDFVTDEELQSAIDSYGNPHLTDGDNEAVLSKTKVLDTFAMKPQEERLPVRKKVLNRIYRDIATDQLGAEQFASLPTNEKKEALKKAREHAREFWNTPRPNNKKPFTEVFDDFLYEMEVEGQYAQIATNSKMSKRTCPECRGRGTIANDAEGVEGDTKKCPTCGGERFIDSGKAKTIDPELMATLVGDAKKILSQLTANKRPTKNDEDAVVNDWVAALMKALPKGFLGSQDTDGNDVIKHRARAMLLKVLESEQRLMRSFKTERTQGNEDDTEGSVWLTTTHETPKISRRVLSHLSTIPKAKEMVRKHIAEPKAGVKWGFQAGGASEEGQVTMPHQKSKTPRVMSIRELSEKWERYPTFIEVRAFANKEEHLQSMFRDIAKYSSKMSGFVESRIHSPNILNILLEAFAQGGSDEIDNALEEFKPRADEVRGIGLVIGVEREETDEFYSDPNLHMIKKLAKIHKVDAKDSKVRSKLKNLLIALQLAAKEAPNEVDPTNDDEDLPRMDPTSERDIGRMLKHWKSLTPSSQKRFKGLAKNSVIQAKNSSSTDTTKVNYGRLEATVAKESYTVKYMDIATGKDGVLHFSDGHQMVFIVEPLGEISRKAKGQYRSELRQKGQEELDGMETFDIPRPASETSESFDRVGQTILEMLSPRMDKRRSVDPEDIASFID